MATTNTKPTESSKETLLGVQLALEKRFGCVPVLNPATTLNTKFGVFQNLTPANERHVRYFSWGVGGSQNDDEYLSSAVPVLGTNMSLYQPRPFRCVPLESDLDAITRQKYGLREVRNINGTDYALYWLKRIDFPQSSVSLTVTNDITNVTESYEIDPDNLSPERPQGDDNGVVADVADRIAVRFPGQITITGQEVYESVGVMDGGDPRFARISEIGFVSASIQSVSTVDANNTPFSYDEAIFAQLCDHRTWVGTTLVSAEDNYTQNLSYLIRNLIGQS